MWMVAGGSPLVFTLFVIGINMKRKGFRKKNFIGAQQKNVLMAAQIEGHSIELQKEEFDLSKLLDQTIHDKKDLYHLTHEITSSIAENVSMKGDALAIGSMVLNLIENAEKYSPTNSKTHVELINRDRYIVIRVSDNGTGIPADEKEKVF